MVRRVFARLSSVALVAALWVSLLAAPTAAAGTVRWVDDNAGATGPAACDTAGYTSIQAAIDASSAWDVVKVCPGTYYEQLVIDVKGLTVRAVPARTARIVAPSTLDSPANLVAITANRVTFSDFRINLPAGEANPTVATVNGCSPYQAAVLSFAKRSRVLNNFIDATGNATYGGECGFLYGIVFAGPEVAASSYPAGTSRAAWNVVRDFKVGGVLVAGASAHVDHNSVRFLHLDDDTIFASASEVGGAGFPSLQTGGDPNGIFFASFGVGVELGYADVHRNVVRGALDLYSGPTGPYLYSGIWLMNADDASRVRGNTVYGVWGAVTLGVVLTSASSVVAGFPTGGGGYEVYNNTLSDSYIGLGVGTSDNDIHHNRIRLNFAGIDVVDGENNTIWKNDARFNFEIDCYDGTAGGGTAGTANWWTDNRGLTDSPDGICISPAF